MGGRPPLPIKYHKLKKGKLYNTFKEREDLTEPKEIEHIEPQPPPVFSKEEKTAWAYYEAIMRNYGLFEIANAPYLIMLCRAQADYDALIDKARIIIVKDPAGLGYITNPFYTQRRQTEDTIMKCLSALGLSTQGMAKIGSVLAGVRESKRKKGIEDLMD